MRRGTVAISIALVAVALSVWAVQDFTTATERQQSDAYWELTWLPTDEVEVFTSVQEMTRSVDWVVEGTVEGTAPSRVVVDEQGSPIGWYARVDIDVSRTLVGDQRRSISIEAFFLSEARYEDFLNRALPTEESIFFIRNKGVAARAAGWGETDADRESGYNMLVNLSQSLFRIFDGRISTPDQGQSDFTAQWEGQSVETAITAMEAVTR